MSRESNQVGEGLSNLHPLSEGVVGLPYVNHLDSRKWERYQHLGGLNPRRTNTLNKARSKAPKRLDADQQSTQAAGHLGLEK